MNKPSRSDRSRDSRSSSAKGRASNRGNSRDNKDSRRASGSKKTSGASRASSKPRSDQPKEIDGSKREEPRRLEPEIPQEIYREEIDKQLLHELSSLASDNAEQTARHLLALAYFMSEDPERAYTHGVAASARAARVGRVRELAGIAAYNAGKFDVALRELKTAFRITGDPSMWPMICDAQRGLGEPIKAIELAKAPEAKKLDKDGQIELRIVLSGARRDLGEIDAALTALECKELSEENPIWSARLRYAYADVLEVLGRKDEAVKWFEKAAAVDINQETDSRERAVTLKSR